MVRSPITWFANWFVCSLGDSAGRFPRGLAGSAVGSFVLKWIRKRIRVLIGRLGVWFRWMAGGFGFWFAVSLAGSVVGSGSRGLVS